VHIPSKIVTLVMKVHNHKYHYIAKEFATVFYRSSVCTVDIRFVKHLQTFTRNTCTRHSQKQLELHTEYLYTATLQILVFYGYESGHVDW
jgi:hypothetical protein